jgi:SAM-dependent methyltransferase
MINSDGESEKLLQMINKYAQVESKILDVGCGYGRNLELLLNAGYKNSLGVEINVEIVKHNMAHNLSCVTVEDFNQTLDKYDIILMSHVIEHFSPSDLKNFMDSYLDRLIPGGHLVIATPLLSDYFYDDFDHIKPYQPAGILAVFGEGKAQVQYYSRNKLELKDLWFRKSPYRLSFTKGLYLKTRFRRMHQIHSFISALIFHVTNKFLGKKDGWVGIFEKVAIV